MSASPRTVAVDTVFLWDGAPQRLARGQVMDVTPDSALERAIGRDRLASLRGTPLPPPVEPVEAVEPVEPAPVKARTEAKKQDDAKDGAP
jgi:hypothetical protein